MRKIALTKGEFAIIDDEDYEKVSQFSWYVRTADNGMKYAKCTVYLSEGKLMPNVANNKRGSLIIRGSNGRIVSQIKRGEPKILYMHRLLVSPKENEYIDHINQNSLDNRKSNLRICTKQENQFNRRLQKNNTTGYKGVTLDRERKRVTRYMASIGYNGKHIKIGRFPTAKEAAIAYNKKAQELFGNFAGVNII